MKSNLVFSLMIIIVLAMSSIAYAAGGGGGGGSRPKPVTTDVPAEEEKTCDELTSLSQRVKCRLEKGGEEGVHESCNAAADKSACAELYKEVYPCYSKSGKSKDKCFRNVAGESKRNYVLFLLYDLEERAEKAYDAGKITSDRAAFLISKIIDIKKKVIGNESPTRVRPFITELRKMWGTEIQ
ncbi:MAG TPA: hypothetical protein VJC07_01845 [Candidatus Nanoarchaeia archaeon]|nr:hypothetical protein [Candidatus Nanoarchaeia archaeon]